MQQIGRKGQNNPLRLSFYELKIDRKQGAASVTSNRQHISKSTKTSNQGYHSTHKKSNPQDLMILSTNLEKNTQRISHIMLTLPQIKTQQLELDAEDDRMGTYGSTRLVQGAPKTDKLISKRYYKQMELMREVRNPAISQKVFTISQLHNKDLDNNLLPRKVSKKPTMPLCLDKFQMVKSKEEVFIPTELQSRKFESFSLGEVTKRALRFKFDSQLRIAEKNAKVRENRHDRGFRLEGWNNEIDGEQLC